MLKITKLNPAAGELRLALEGTIDDELESILDFLDDSTTAVALNCEKIDIITSLGIMKWMEMFDHLRSSGRKLTFLKCSPAVMRTNSMMRKGLISRQETESFLLPYYCESCNKVYSYLSSPDQLDRGKGIPSRNCEVHPGCELELDEIPEIFFG